VSISRYGAVKAISPARSGSAQKAVTPTTPAPAASTEPTSTAGAEQIDPLLARAVAAVGGSARPGQQQMAQAVAESLTGGRHLLVQAGTGTGKSLGYLVPVIVHAVRTGRPVVVSTATLALQAQVVDRDLPRLADALAPVLGRRPTWQLVKGRRNYVCVNKLTGGYPAEEDSLFELPEGVTGTTYGASSTLGREVVRLREWAESTSSGDRDELVPGVSERAWRQEALEKRG